MARKLNLATPADRAVHRKRLQLRKAKERREQRELIRLLEQADCGVSAKALNVLVIPSGFSGTSTLSGERIGEYKAHLRRLIREADDEPDVATARTEEKMRQRAELNEAKLKAEPELRQIGERLCGLCKGGCCTAGANTAFIDGATIRRLRGRLPHFTEEQILDVYLSRLAAVTITDACINQTPTGCGLPRALRSDTCNGFFCDSLTHWHDYAKQERADKVLAIQRSECFWDQKDLKRSNHIVDAALVTAESVEPLARFAEFPRFPDPAENELE